MKTIAPLVGSMIVDEYGLQIYHPGYPKMPIEVMFLRAEYEGDKLLAMMCFQLNGMDMDRDFNAVNDRLTLPKEGRPSLPSDYALSGAARHIDPCQIIE